MDQDELIDATFRMASCSVRGLYKSNNTGTQELAQILHNLADVVGKSTLTYADFYGIVNQLAAWNRAKLELLKESQP